VSKLNDLTGQRFGRLAVIKRADNYVSPKGQNLTQWLCRCDCGKETITTSRNLVSGNTQSCGCLHNEITSKSKTIHGMRDNRLYYIWHGMIDRCECDYSTSYYNYGKRGISVCGEWHEFTSFMEWALTNGYTDDLTIDRIDNSGNYEPNNCKWSTRVEQANNTRRNHVVTFGGKTQTMMQWSRELGLSYSSLKHRLGDLGWSVQKALTTPPMFNKYTYKENAL
jgi:hypothetical protein